MKGIACLLATLLALAPARAEPRNPLDALQLEALTATRERPLFRPDRHAPALVPIATPTPEPPPTDDHPVALGPPPFDLVGAVVGRDMAIALLRNHATNEVVRLRQGDDADGWRIGAIALRTVTLERDGRTQSLALSAPVAAPTGAEVASEPQPAESVAAPPTTDLRRVAGRMRPDR